MVLTALSSWKAVVVECCRRGMLSDLAPTAYSKKTPTEQADELDRGAIHYNDVLQNCDSIEDLHRC
jgi:hypothetical protein